MNIKNILVAAWNAAVDAKNDARNRSLMWKDMIVSHLIAPPCVQSMDDTLMSIIDRNASVCRYGDGELKLMLGKDITFQRADERLSERLADILQSADERVLVCIPDVFQDLSSYTEEPASYWRLHTAKFRTEWYKRLRKEKVYYNSFISRFYYSFQDKSMCPRWIILLKSLWDKRDVVLIEGRKSRLGIGNDLFDNVKSVQRILVPEENAFAKYEDIFAEAKRCDKSKLILLAAGPTATVLAYDLHQAGYQAIDIGHVDIEYEWFLRGATTKLKIENKYVCEAGAGEGVGDLQDERYVREIKAVIL